MLALGKYSDFVHSSQLWSTTVMTTLVISPKESSEPHLTSLDTDIIPDRSIPLCTVEMIGSMVNLCFIIILFHNSSCIYRAFDWRSTRGNNKAVLFD